MLVLQVIFLWCLPIIYIIPWRKMQFKRMLLFFFVFFFWLFFFAPPPTPTYWFWKRRITFFISKNMTEFFPLSSNSISQMFQFAHSSMLFDLFEKKDGGEERNKEKKYIKVTYSFNKKKKKCTELVIPSFEELFAVTIRQLFCMWLLSVSRT